MGLVLLVLALPLLLGAWKIITEKGINPSYVERIQDGKTKKHEILTLFGDPEEIDRTPSGLVYTYKSFREKETLPGRQSGERSVQDSPYFNENWMKNLPKEKDSSKELDSVLIIRFDPDGQTVRSHEFKEY